MVKFDRIIVVCFSLILGLSSCHTVRRAADESRRDIAPEFNIYHSDKLGYRLVGTENPLLIREVSSWMGVPHRYGGMNRSGADCSGFVWNVYMNTFEIRLPRSTEGMSGAVRKIRKRRLREGDLVFFRTMGRKTSHVGIFLSDNKFIHASTSRGVVVNDLNEPYYAKRFVYGGRVSR